MNEIELIDGLIEEFNRLTYRDHNKLDAILRRTELIISKIFGDNSHYLSDLKKIHYYPPFGPTEEDTQIHFWNDGKGDLSNLFNVMKEDIELSKKIWVQKTGRNPNYYR